MTKYHISTETKRKDINSLISKVKKLKGVTLSNKFKKISK